MDIDPLDLPGAMLPHLLLIDVERQPLEFRYRLAGTAADTVHGQSLRGVRIGALRLPMCGDDSGLAVVLVLADFGATPD